MHIIHGFWLPDDSQEFMQDGKFYLWVETDTAQAVAKKGLDGVHPRHLAQDALQAFLVEKLGLQELLPGALANGLCSRCLLLPTVAGRPTPSFELLRYVEEEEPLEFELNSWHICCYQVTEIITTLNTIHFMALNGAEDFQLGADLLFWQQYTQALKAIIAKDQYIPALKYQPLEEVKEKGKRSKKTARFALHPAWELIADSYESTIQRYVAAMPGACVAGTNSPGSPSLFDKEALLRHFSECLLHNIIIGTPFTGAFDHQIADTLLYKCIYPYRPLPSQDPAKTLQEYKDWLAWRNNLTQAHREAGFTLCLRLEEAEATDVDSWHMHFLVASRRDPSHQLSLFEYWNLEPQARAQAIRSFGDDFEKNLLLALGYAARIYPLIWKGLTTDKPIGFHLTLDQAFTFLKEGAWILEDAGYIVIIPSWWTPEGRRRSKVRLKASLRSSKGSTAAAGGGHLSLKKIVDYSYELSIGGQVVSEEEWRQLVNAKSSLVLFRGQWMELDREKMLQMLTFWQTHKNESAEISLMDLLKLGAEGADDLEWEYDQDLQDMLSQLDAKNAISPITDPVALQGSLREYQKRGVAWLYYLESLGLNPCLADDMGLGKTLQVIACLLKEREANESIGPTLIIAPTSVLGNWRKEIERFAPPLKVLVHQGGARPKEKKAFLETYQGQDVILTSFTLARLDEKLLQSIDWHRVVVDEAQNIKNPQAAQTRAILKLDANHRLALTGTPVENRLRDLWSIFNFLNPGYLGKEAQFRKKFEVPIYKDNNSLQSATLKKLVEPFILRRVKTDKRIINDLPDKVEQKMYCTLSAEQASLYEAVVKDVMEQLDSAEGMQRRGLILATLLKLKQICNHPMQFLQDGSAFSTERSHKLQRLAEMVEEAIESGESALIFTQFTEIGDALQRYLEHKKYYNTYYLHGGTSVARRERMVTEFQDPATEPSLFILSLRAGGVGLNLTKANHVFHFDRWWNPAVEDQATDRAFRIGQRKSVFVHKFIAMGTMEERIDAMIEDKKRLSSLVVGTDESWLTELDNNTFKELITLRRSAIME